MTTDSQARAAAGLERGTVTRASATQTPSWPETFSPDPAGLLLTRLTVLPVLAVLFFLMVAFPMLLLGWFRPLPVLVATSLTVLPGVPLSLRYVRRPVRGTPWWVPVALVVIAFGFMVVQLRYRSAFVIVTRDPASYMQFAAWIAQHGSLPIPQDTAAFGTAKHLMEFSGEAFYQVGRGIVPQFMAGLPMVLAAAWWFGGVYFSLSMAPLLGAAAVLTFGGLAARLAGPRWAVPAALTLAAAFPEQFTSRSTYSEPLVQVLLLGGLCLVIDAQRAERETRAARVLAALAGLALGITLLVRLDGVSDTLLVIPWCGALLVARRPQALPLCAGMIAGTSYGVIDGRFLTLPYVMGTISSVRPLMFLTLFVTGATAVAVMVARRGVRLPRPRWLPAAAAALPFVVLAGAAIRALTAKPVREHHAAHSVQWVNYSGHSLQWLIWWVGLPIVIAATAGAAMVARRVLLGRSPEWMLALLIFGWTIAVFLARPGITPDQPWASRRLVPAVLPGCILLAAWACSWLAMRLGKRLARRPAKLFGACCGLAFVAQPAWIAFQPHLSSANLISLRGLAVRSTYRGQLAAVRRLCAAMPPDSSVVVTDGPIAAWLLEAIRGMCGVPAAELRGVTTARVNQAVRGIEQTGRRAVVLGHWPTDVKAYPDKREKLVMNLHTQFDAHDVTGVPSSTQTFTIRVWMWEQTGPARS